MKTPDFDLTCDSDLAYLVWKEARYLAAEEGGCPSETLPEVLRMAERKADILSAFLEDIFR